MLRTVNDGVLRERVVREYAIGGKWILDFFIPEVRLGIEVDGSSHHTAYAAKRDRDKEAMCAQLGITLIRLTNADVLGDHDQLVQKLRTAWRDSLRRLRERDGE